MSGTRPFGEPAYDRIVANDADTFALRDGYPISPGHSLIVPRWHIASLADLEPDEARSLWSLGVAARLE